MCETCAILLVVNNKRIKYGLAFGYKRNENF